MDIASTKRNREKSHNWQGGKTSEAKLIRRSAAWGKWRKAVFERDNYTCQHCGARSEKGKPVELHPHHIKQFAHFPELRFEISNGLTLCQPCHKKVHSKKHEAPHKNLS
jgi:5-methylcytosine-specific restriction endonuclease McrA